MAMLAETYTITLYMNKDDPIISCSNSQNPSSQKKEKEKEELILC